MKHWQDYVKPNYPGPVDADGFNDTGYFVSIPGVKDSPSINLKGGLLCIERYPSF